MFFFLRQGSPSGWLSCTCPAVLRETKANNPMVVFFFCFGVLTNLLYEIWSDKFSYYTLWKFPENRVSQGNFKKYKQESNNQERQKLFFNPCGYARLNS